MPWITKSPLSSQPSLYSTTRRRRLGLLSFFWPIDPCSLGATVPAPRAGETRRSLAHRDDDGIPPISDPRPSLTRATPACTPGARVHSASAAHSLRPVHPPSSWCSVTCLFSPCGSALAHLAANGKIRFQSSCMLTTVQPLACAASSALSSRPMADVRS